MIVDLDPQFEQLIEQQVKAGVYPSSSAAVNAALARMFTEQSPEEISELRSLIDEGLADLDAGRFVDEFDLNAFLAERHREFAAKNGS